MDKESQEVNSGDMSTSAVLYQQHIKLTMLQPVFSVLLPSVPQFRIRFDVDDADVISGAF